MTDARAQLIEHISTEAVFHGDFTLTSGKKASYYIDLRKVSLDHRVAPLIGQVMVELLAQIPDVDAGGLGDFAHGGLRIALFHKEMRRFFKDLHLAFIEKIFVSFGCRIGFRCSRFFHRATRVLSRKLHPL